jgi:hypothetical protein
MACLDIRLAFGLKGFHSISSDAAHLASLMMEPMFIQLQKKDNPIWNNQAYTYASGVLHNRHLTDSGAYQ